MSYYNKILNYIYNGDITFGITSEKVDDFSKDTVGNIYSEFMTLLDELSERRLTGDTALATTKKFVDMLNRDYGEKSVKMFKMILDKDFKCGVNVKTMAKVFPVKLPFTEYVALANKYFDREDKVDFDNETWLWSRKLDGNRLILIKNKSGVRCFSRQGKEIKTLDVLINIIGKVDGDFVLDGEVCIIDDEGNENFQEIMKVITKKNYTIEHPVMKVFDILSEDEFFGRKKSESFCMRYERRKVFFENNSTITDNFNLVEQTKVESKDDLMKQFAKSREKGWEGLMIRKDVPYECGRTNNLLKVKGFFDNEYEVVDYEMGNMRFVEEGRQVEKEVLSAIVIKHKGFNVKVGSGFSKEEREYLHDHPEEIKGSIVKVQYFEETNNMQGGISLRFPTVIYFYGKDGRFD
jgi:DNA ligase-1